MKLRTVRRILFGLLGACCVLMLLMAIIRAPWAGIAGLGTVVAYGIVAVIWWRCPHCGRALGSIEKLRFCKHCGGKIEL